MVMHTFWHSAPDINEAVGDAAWASVPRPGVQAAVKVCTHAQGPSRIVIAAGFKPQTHRFR